jgi:hypothetical protein
MASSAGSRKIRRLIIKALIIFHIAMLLFTVSRLVEYVPRHKLTRPLIHLSVLYSKITLNNQRFAFFAPNVPNYLTPQITCTDTSGRQFEYRFPIPNREVQIRFNKMVRYCAMENFRDGVARSWANYIKLHHPEVIRIDVLINEHFTPTMEEYKSGKRSIVKPYYKVSFR